MAEQQQPPQKQSRQPGREHEMTPEPEYMPRFPGVGKLKGKVALITGGDSGIGRAVAIGMAREGADIGIVYLEEHQDAAKTVELVEAEGAKAIRLAGDIGEEAFCREAVENCVSQLGGLNILVNNAAQQYEVDDLTELTQEQLELTFRSNVFGYFYMTKAALPHMKSGDSIVNTTSITAYQGHPTLLDYSATRGAIVSFTRSMAISLAERGIRVNGVAPGPIWTPLIPASFEPEKVAKHGASSPMGRAGHPNEVAPCHVFLASEEASYMSGQVMHPNGGTVVNG